MRPYFFQIPDFIPLLGGRPLFSYGIMLGIAFFVGWSFTVLLAERDGYDRKLSSNAVFWAIVGALFGARIFFFFTATDDPLTFANFFKFSEGGLVAYGGYIGGILGAWGYMRWKGASFWGFADSAAPQLALGLGIVRVGCFLYGCDYGTRSEGPFALHFPLWDNPDTAQWIRGSAPAFEAHARSGAFDGAHSVASAGVYPTQLYESLAGFAFFGVLLLLRRYRRFEGQALLSFLVLYSIFRFIIEFFRGDEGRGVGWFGLPFSSSQIIAVGVLLWTAGAWVVLRRLDAGRKARAAA
jgi:phosphatidylglycerol:prolipoprotein diacylglycerol transferase